MNEIVNISEETLVVAGITALQKKFKHPLEISCKYSRSVDSYQGYWRIKLEEHDPEKVHRWKGQFLLQQLPGCCGVCVYHDMIVDVTAKNRGVATFFTQLAERLAWEWGYTTIIATDRKDNEWTKRIFTKRKWEESFEFINRRTDNDVIVWIKDLRK